MDVLAKAKREARFYSGLFRTLARIRDVKPTSPTLACDDLETAVDKHAQRTALTFEGRSLTYAELDAMANRYAHWAKGRGINRGDVVALLAPNRLEYLPVWYGLSKVGVITALINNHLTGAALAHSLNICGAAHLISDVETSPAFAEVRSRVTRSMTEWIIGGAGRHGDRDLDQTLKGVSSLRPTRASARADMTAKDVALYIFTSGTTGLPKAAKVTHMRVQMYMRGFAAATGAKPGDRIYDALPLYHATGGLCAAGAALLTGATLVVKRRFSASQFWDDVAREDCTMFAYIGEVCRYLVNQPTQVDDRRHRLKLAFGNGLRADVWEQLESRFGVSRVLEFYGATEGNVSMLNFDGKLGAVGRVPPLMRRFFNFRLMKFDVEADQPVRDADGRMVPCAPDEIGEVLGHIAGDARSNYTGYADKAATDKKIARDVLEPGDAWFRTGDLMKEDAEGYFYFVDRIGDTFRWKGENVSTTEVELALNEITGVDDANVYGVEVPGSEGRAGMAAMVTTPDFDVEAFQAKVDATLPAYARPVFLRLQPEAATTTTFKLRKTDVAAEGFDPGKVEEKLFYRAGGEPYRALDDAAYASIEKGEVRF